MFSLKNSLIAVLAVVALGCSSGESGGRRFDGPGPMVLHVKITTQSGHGAEMEKTFHETFYPAVSSQAGFKYSDLLKEQGGDNSYVLTIAFESEDLRMRWVATDLHQEVWPQMAAHMSGEAPGGIEALGIVDPPIGE
jgi:heme-degrading monooxygenase HmoA